MKDPHNARRWFTGSLAAATACVLLIALVRAASDQSPAGGKQPPVTLETVAGSAIKRVVLSQKAAERLDVQLGSVTEQAVTRTQVVGAILVDPSAIGFEAEEASAAAKSAKLWVRLALSPPEWERLAKDQPARIFPLQTRQGLPKEMLAKPTGEPPVEVAKSGMLALFFVVPQDITTLAIGDRVRAELQFEGIAAAQKVVPYSAVYYDEKGEAWVYVSQAPLKFMREKVKVERVSGDLALLSSGPAVGTRVATVGVSLLYGTEIFGK